MPGFALPNLDPGWNVRQGEEAILHNKFFPTENFLEDRSIRDAVLATTCDLFRV